MILSYLNFLLKLPEQYRLMSQQPQKKKHKHKKHKHKGGDAVTPDSQQGELVFWWFSHLISLLLISSMLHIF